MKSIVQLYRVNHSQSMSEATKSMYQESTALERFDKRQFDLSFRSVTYTRFFRALVLILTCVIGISGIAFLLINSANVYWNQLIPAFIIIGLLLFNMLASNETAKLS